MNPTPPNNASIDPRPDPDPHWCTECNTNILEPVCWYNSRPYHAHCLPVSREEFNHLLMRVEKLEQMKDLYIHTIIPEPTPIPKNIETKLRILQYPNPEGISREEASWRDFARFVLKLMNEPNGIRRLENVVVDELLHRVYKNVDKFEDNFDQT